MSVTKKVSFLTVIIFLNGCANIPTWSHMEIQRTIHASFDRTWDVTLEDVNKSKVNIITQDKSSGLIVFATHENKLNENHFYLIKLEKWPQRIEIPDSLKDKIRYNEEYKFLFFMGVMSKEEKNTLLNLSTDSKYKKAIKVLFRASQSALPHLYWIALRSPFLGYAKPHYRPKTHLYRTIYMKDGMSPNTTVVCTTDWIIFTSWRVPFLERKQVKTIKGPYCVKCNIGGLYGGCILSVLEENLKGR